MRAYSYSGLSKAEFIAELQMHVEADRLVKGTYFRNGSSWRGCAVGCSLESVRRRLRFVVPFGWHGRHVEYERYLGIPMVLACLEDRIFEALPFDEARLWPLRFSSAIPEGADLSGVWNQFAPWMLREIALPIVTEDEWGVRLAIESVIAGYENGWKSHSAKTSYTAASDARTAIYTTFVDARAADSIYSSALCSATLAAAYAADAAVNATIDIIAEAAEDIAAPIIDADNAADLAANAAAEAARSVALKADFAIIDAVDADAHAARVGAWRRMADKLCALMAEAPVGLGV